MTMDRGASAEAGAGFAPDADNASWIYAGPLTYANAGAVLTAAAALSLPTEGEVDLTDVEAVDSAAVAVLLALKRRAAAEGRSLAFSHIPPVLATLADLYGVNEMLVA